MPGPAQNPPPRTRPPAEAPSHSPQPSTSFTPLSSQSRPQRSTRLPARYRDETNTNSGLSQDQPPTQGTIPHPPIQAASPQVPLPLPQAPLQLQPQAAAPPPLSLYRLQHLLLLIQMMELLVKGPSLLPSQTSPFLIFSPRWKRLTKLTYRPTSGPQKQ